MNLLVLFNLAFLEKNILLFIVISVSISFILSVLINSLLLKFSQNLGSRQIQKDIRWNATIKPSLGGISFFVIFLITFIIMSFINNILPVHYSNLKIIGIFVACTLAFLMGLADDAYNTKPLLKFTVQLTCGLILYFTDIKVQLFSNDMLNLLFTVIWTVGIMNSINMLDNMDAITTSVSIIILLFTITLSLSLNTMLYPLPILSLGMLGALLGFLLFNWHPSKMFMGDTGSQFLGCFLAIIGIKFCWNASHLTGNNWFMTNQNAIGIIATLLVFIIPITDTSTVIINRLRKGKSPFIGGKDHTTHHLFFKGFTEPRIALIYIMLSIISITLALQIIINYQMLWFIISLIFIVIVFLALYINTVLKSKK